jgi:murein DD-endopeptidase MepM/ murein hydrolase activator NlpD
MNPLPAAWPGVVEEPMSNQPHCRAPRPRLLLLGLLLPVAALAASLPEPAPPQPLAAATLPGSPPADDGEVLRSLQAPLLRPRVTSPFGERFNPVMRRKVFHRGVDYGATAGTPVYAAQGGVVEAMGLQDHSGIYVRLRHSEGVETVYAHLHRVMPGLRAGSRLRRGDVLGFVGASGFATGPHLHYEILLRGRPIDPEQRRADVRLASFR